MTGPGKVDTRSERLCGCKWGKSEGDCGAGAPGGDGIREAQCRARGSHLRGLSPTVPVTLGRRGQGTQGLETLTLGNQGKKREKVDL